MTHAIYYSIGVNADIFFVLFSLVFVNWGLFFPYQILRS